MTWDIISFQVKSLVTLCKRFRRAEPKQVGTETGLAESGISVKIFSLKLHLGYIRKCNEIKDIYVIFIPAVFTI